MNTRKFLHLLLALAGLTLAVAAHAGEFSMGQATLAQSGVSNADADVVSSVPASLGGDSGSSRYARGGETMASGVSDVNSSEPDEDASPSLRSATAPTHVNGTRSALPNAAPAVPAKSRSNRWQSLVPGAIK